MLSSTKWRKEREPSGVLVQSANRSKNYSPRAAAAAKPAIQALAYGCTAPEMRVALRRRRGRATRRMEIRSNTQRPPADNQTHNLVVEFPRTTHARQLAGFPLPARRQVPILRPCQFRKARGRSAARCNSEKTP